MSKFEEIWTVALWAFSLVCFLISACVLIDTRFDVAVFFAVIGHTLKSDYRTALESIHEENCKQDR